MPDLTILSWNIDGVTPYAARGSRRLHDIVEGFGPPAIVCLQEIRARPNDNDLIEDLRAALPGYTCHLSLCSDRENVKFRGGRAYGVATYVADALAPITHAPLAWDREGRAVVTLLEAMRLAIVNVYAVNGTSKPYWDHERGAFFGDRHGFKRRFNGRLVEDCRAIRAHGFELVLIGDWNISRAAIDTHPRLRTEEPHAGARREFNETFIPALGVVDVFRALHPNARRYTWFSRRAPPGTLDAARVDFALVSETLLPRVRSAEILDDPPHRFDSDHAPLTVTLADRG